MLLICLKDKVKISYKYDFSTDVNPDLPQQPSISPANHNRYLIRPHMAAET